MKLSKELRKLGDFTTTMRVLPIAGLAMVIGVIGAYVALGLLRLIGLFTNLFYYQRIGTAMVSPAGNHLGWWAVLVPVVGGIVIGFMARYGSDKIRGHGIPEAIEAILINGSRVEPKVALLKPLSSAISIGSGGPFGAEGPIIMTGGAIGSMIAQLLHLTSAERKTLLVGALPRGWRRPSLRRSPPCSSRSSCCLFEWKPRSLIPVALSCATAAAARRYIMGMGPLFPVVQHPAFIGPRGRSPCARGHLCRRAVSAADAGGLRGRGCLSKVKDLLDVVASAWRSRDWNRRSDLSAGARSWLRYDRRVAASGRQPPGADHHRRPHC